MKFAFSANAFRRHSLAEAIDTVARLGYAGIEIMADVPHAFPRHLTDGDVREIGRRLSDQGLDISNLNAFMHHADGDTYHPSWIEADPSLRAKRIDYTLRCIELARKLGAPTLSTEPGGPLPGISRQEGLRWFLDGLAAVEGAARDAEIRILIEPEPGLLIENSTQFLEMMESLPREVFGLNFDIGHFFCVGEDPSQLVVGLKDFTHHFHLEDIAESREHYHLIPGEGAIDFSAVLGGIRSIGFQGFVTIELYTYEDRPEEAARRALHHVSKLGA